MLNLFNISPQQFQLFLLIQARIGGVIIFAPVLGNKNIPAKMKIGLSLLLGFLLFPVVPAVVQSVIVMDHVESVARIVNIPVVVASAEKRIIARSALQDIVPAPCVQHIAPGAAGDSVLAGAAVNGIVPGPAVQPVVAGTTTE